MQTRVITRHTGLTNYNHSYSPVDSFASETATVDRTAPNIMM